MEPNDFQPASRSETPTRWRRLSLATAALVVGTTLAPVAGAQTPAQFAAWDALMLSPVGAFTSSIHSETPSSTVALRFGRWRYNTDDAAHETYGITLSRRLGSRSRGSITVGYGYLSCVDCGGWEVGGLDFETTLWQHAASLDQPHALQSSLGVRLDAGGAHLRGDPASAGRSVALEAPLNLGVRYRTGGTLRASLTPGFGFGRMWAPGGTNGGFLPMLGLAVASDLTSSLGMELGAHRVFIDGGPNEIGVSLIWGFR